MREVDCNLCGENRLQEVANRNGVSVVRCKSCSLYFAVLPKAPQANEIFSEDYFAKRYPKFRLVENYADSIDGRRDLELLRCLRALGGQGVLLDVGAGLGLFLNLARREGWQPLGIEPSPWACNFARDRFSLHFLQRDLKDAGLADSSVDAAVCQHVLNCVEDATALLREVHRVLKTGGLFALTVPVQVSSLEGRLRGPSRWVSPPLVRFYFSWRVAERYLLNCGFGQIVKRRMNFSLEAFIRVAMEWAGHRMEDGFESALARASQSRVFSSVVQGVLKPMINKVAAVTRVGDELTLIARKG